jgi:hypothetical protein
MQLALKCLNKPTYVDPRRCIAESHDAKLACAHVVFNSNETNTSRLTTRLDARSLRKRRDSHAVPETGALRLPARLRRSPLVA